MAQQLKELAALSDDQVRFPALLILGDSQLQQLQGLQPPFLVSLANCTHMYMHTHTDLHINKSSYLSLFLIVFPWFGFFFFVIFLDFKLSEFLVFPHILKEYFISIFLRDKNV